MFSCVWLFTIPWTVVLQAPLSMGILQASILEWVAMPSSKGSSQHRDWNQVSCIAGGFFTSWATRNVQIAPKEGIFPNDHVTVGLEEDGQRTFLKTEIQVLENNVQRISIWRAGPESNQGISSTLDERSSKCFLPFFFFFFLVTVNIPNSKCSLSFRKLNTNS